MQHSMRLFRAQRNFYISGFSIFLTLVIRRLVILISAQAQLLAQSEASMRQAQSATVAARTLLSQQKDDKSSDAKKGDGKPDELVRNRTIPTYSNLNVFCLTYFQLHYSEFFACHAMFVCFLPFLLSS